MKEWTITKTVIDGNEKVIYFANGISVHIVCSACWHRIAILAKMDTPIDDFAKAIKAYGLTKSEKTIFEFAEPYPRAVLNIWKF